LQFKITTKPIETSTQKAVQNHLEVQRQFKILINLKIVTY